MVSKIEFISLDMSKPVCYNESFNTVAIPAKLAFLSIFKIPSSIKAPYLINALLIFSNLALSSFSISCGEALSNSYSLIIVFFKCDIIEVYRFVIFN